MNILSKLLFTILLLLFALTPLTVCADDTTDANAILQKAEATLAVTKSITMDISGTISDSRPDRNPLVSFSATVNLVRPNLAQIRYEESTKDREGKTSKKQQIVVSDGLNLWQFSPDRKEYRKTRVDAGGNDIHSPANLPLGMFFRSHIPHIEETPTYVGTEKWDGQECRVIEFAAPGIHQSLWIGADNIIRHLVNEQLEGKYREEWTLSNIHTATPLMSEQFAFTPPSDAKEYVPPAPPALLPVGTLAPDFTVMDRAGKPVKLSDFRGKVVVLDFWATWCGPCMESLPQTNAVAKKLSGNVVVLAVNVWDKRDAFDSWLPKHPEFDSLIFAIDSMPQGKDIGTTLYRVPGLPTQYVIGKDGKIARGFLGFGGPTTALENAIKAAGANL